MWCTTLRAGPIVLVNHDACAIPPESSHVPESSASSVPGNICRHNIEETSSAHTNIASETKPLDPNTSEILQLASRNPQLLSVVDQNIANLKQMFRSMATPLIDMYLTGISGRPVGSDRAAFGDMLAQTVFNTLDDQQCTVLAAYGDNLATAALINIAWNDLKQVLAEQVQVAVAAKWYDT